VPKDTVFDAHSLLIFLLFEATVFHCHCAL